MFIAKWGCLQFNTHAHTRTHVCTHQTHNSTTHLVGTLVLHCPGGMLGTLLSAHLQPLPRQSAGKEAEMKHSSNTGTQLEHVCEGKKICFIVCTYTNHCGNAPYTILRHAGIGGNGRLLLDNQTLVSLLFDCLPLDMLKRVCAGASSSGIGVPGHLAKVLLYC